jgi:hypothetical protein
MAQKNYSGENRLWFQKNYRKVTGIFKLPSRKLQNGFEIINPQLYGRIYKSEPIPFACRFPALYFGSAIKTITVPSAISRNILKYSIIIISLSF